MKVTCARPEKNIYERVQNVGGWGGTCTCPDGQEYAVGDRHDGCANGRKSLACVGGHPGKCEKSFQASRKGMQASCAAPQENVYKKVDDVGSWGGWCTCPDGQRYNVGDQHDKCGSLACVGGTAGSCQKTVDPARKGMKVFCAAAAMPLSPTEVPTAAPTPTPTPRPNPSWNYVPSPPTWNYRPEQPQWGYTPDEPVWSHEGR